MQLNPSQHENSHSSFGAFGGSTRARFNVKIIEPLRAGLMELIGQISPAGRTLPTPGLMGDIDCCFEAREIPGIKIFSFSSSLYYANATHFVRQLYKRTDCNPELIKHERMQQERRRADAERKRKKAQSVTSRRKKRLQLTADQDNRMFTVLVRSFHTRLKSFDE